MLFVRITHAIDCLQFLEQISIGKLLQLRKHKNKRLTIICHGGVQAIKTERKNISE